MNVLEMRQLRIKNDELRMMKDTLRHGVGCYA
jgi:hypothetical protein